MRISSEDQKLIRALAQKHQVSDGAVEALFVAVVAGHGTSAQFDHPDLGGMGQWMDGGMIMIGDFSNHRLRATVAQLCSEIADYLRVTSQPSRHSFSSTGMDAEFPSAVGWWPQEFGRPTASGGQNSMHYAYFAQKKRLAIRTADRVRIYDTKEHQVHSVSQQQDQKQQIVFRSQKGEVSLDTLSMLGEYTL